MAPWGDTQSVNKKGDLQSTFQMSRIPNDIKMLWCPSAFLHLAALLLLLPLHCPVHPISPSIPASWGCPHTNHLCLSSPLKQVNWTIQTWVAHKGQSGRKKEHGHGKRLRSVKCNYACQLPSFSNRSWAKFIILRGTNCLTRKEIRLCCWQSQEVLCGTKSDDLFATLFQWPYSYLADPSTRLHGSNQIVVSCKDQEVEGREQCHSHYSLDHVQW